MHNQVAISEPKVTVSIISYNGMKTLPDCLEAVSNQTYSNISIIVVNNASTDGTPDWVMEHYPQVKLVHYPKNKGPNPARNQGILHAESDLVLLLDDDAFMEPTCVAELVNASQSISTASVWAPRLVYSDRPQVIQHEGVHIHYVAEAVLVNGDVPVQQGLTAPTQVSSVSGTCLLFKKKAAIAIGLFDEDYFFGRADGEFAFRLTLAGYQLFTIPQAVVRHRVKKRGLSKVFYQVRNRWYFTLTMYSWRTLIFSLPALLVYEGALAVFLAAKGAAGQYFAANWAVLRDFSKIMEKRRSFQPKKTVRDRDILKSTPINMRTDLLDKPVFAALKSGLDGFFNLYWQLIYPLI